MANYSVNLTDNSDGSFTISAIKRAPTTVASGGTELKTTFADVNSSNTFIDLGTAFLRSALICENDRAKNG